MLLKQELAAAQSQISTLDVRGRSREDFLRLRAMIKLAAGDTEGALKDVNDAVALNPKNPNALQLNGDVLAKMGRREEAAGITRRFLPLIPSTARRSLRWDRCRANSATIREAEKYFQKLAAAYPHLYVPHLSLGDLYTSRRDFAKAESEYRKAHEFAPTNSKVVAGATNAAIEAHQYPLAAQWLDRATHEMQQDPQVLREKNAI